MLYFVLVLSAILAAAYSEDFLLDPNLQPFGNPEQIHISYTGSSGELYVTWVTFVFSNHSAVEYGLAELSSREPAEVTVFTDGGLEKVVRYIYRCHLRGLSNENTYVYHVGGDGGWSSIFYFTVPPAEPRWAPNFAIFGDMGTVNPQALPLLQHSAQMGQFNLIWHLGDFAYNMNDDNGRVGDEFMRQIQSMAGYVPYMTAVGNHEIAYNFSHYRNRFTMPGDKEGMYYSFDYGPVHFVIINTEAYYAVQYGWGQIAWQYQWLEDDLKKANANRQKVPWVIVMGHKPMYCSNWDGDDCTLFENILRVGLPILHTYALEPLLYQYGVDLAVWAHEHSYERMWPVYNRTIYNGTAHPYQNPCAPVHIVTGSAGNKYGHNPFEPKYPPWSALRSTDSGFTRMKVFNNTHLFIEQVSIDKGGSAIDLLWIQKDHHGPYDESLCQDPGTYIPYDMAKPDWVKPCPHCGNQ